VVIANHDNTDNLLKISVLFSFLLVPRGPWTTPLKIARAHFHALGWIPFLITGSKVIIMGPFFPAKLYDDKEIAHSVSPIPPLMCAPLHA
jgi:hypothetical protein